MDIKNIFQGIPQTIDHEAFEDILSSENVRIERIVSEAISNDEWYDQSENEWVIVIQGSAKLLFEENHQEISLEKGDHVLIPAHKKHKVTYVEQNIQTIWLAIFFK